MRFQCEKKNLFNFFGVGWTRTFSGIKGEKLFFGCNVDGTREEARINLTNQNI